MNVDEFKKELNVILNGINRNVTDPVAVTNSGTYVRLKRAKQDIKEAIDCLK